MAQYNIKIPMTSQSFYTESQAQANRKKVMGEINQKYARIIYKISKYTNVPTQLIDSIIFIESSGDAMAKTGCCTGLMMLGMPTASDVIVREIGAGRLNKYEKQIIYNTIGARWNSVGLDKIKKGQTTLGKTFITRNDLYNPEFNILVGSMLLGQLMDEFSQEGETRLDKLAVVYSKGRYGDIGKTAIRHKGSTDSLISKVPKASRYIKKLVGKNGMLDVL
jgi:soluble lytic murein transglycosylase-like protein